jgi:hypothetical protein
VLRGQRAAGRAPPVRVGAPVSPMVLLEVGVGHVGATCGPQMTGSQRTTAITTGPSSAQLTRHTPHGPQVAVTHLGSLTQKQKRSADSRPAHSPLEPKPSGKRLTTCRWPGEARPGKFFGEYTDQIAGQLSDGRMAWQQAGHSPLRDRC